MSGLAQSGHQAEQERFLVIDKVNLSNVVDLGIETMSSAEYSR
jgi:hypothetical protein